MTAVLIHSGDVLTPFEAIADGAVVVRDGRIERVGPRSELEVGLLDERIDAAGGYICPGFIDLQVNGGGGVMLTEEPSTDAVERMAQGLVRGGTTSFLATIVTAPEERMLRALEAVRDAQREPPPGARVLGAHLEGPFINPVRRGAHDERYIREPDVELFRRFLNAAGGSLRMITIAPELPGAFELITAAREAGVIVSIGHTDASYEETLRAIEAGAAFGTHIFNAMRPLTQRDPGVIGALLTSDIMVGLIADGVHVHPANLDLVNRAKGAWHVALVTDALGAEPGATSFRLYGREIAVRDGACYLPDGTLAGSALTMARAVRNMCALAGVPLLDAVRTATATPASVLGRTHEVGVLRPGASADVVILDRDLSVRTVLVDVAVAHEGRATSD
jgi:N-acetylglucosamine-6-phosphate deacetylase